MSDDTLALSITVALLIALFLWVVVLDSADTFVRGYPADGSEEMPNLVEEDYSPQFTGEVV